MIRVDTALRPSAWVFVSLALVMLVSLDAAGELVTPSDNVVSQLNVRKGPGTNTRIVGKLRPNAYALLKGGVSSWYEVRLRDETQGFVKSSRSEIVPDLRLGTWNIQKLGHGSSKDHELVADIIEDHFDLLTVIEVMQKGGGHPGYDNLLAALGSGWGGLVTNTPRPNTGAGYAEYYAVLFRNTAVRPCDDATGLIYFEDNDGSPDGRGPDRFSREPAYTCMQVLSPSGEPTWDLMLAAYHATWSDGRDDLISSEVDVLDDVFRAMRALRANEQDLLIAGDFNLVPDELRGLVNATDATTGRGSTLNKDGERTLNLYDHILVWDRNETDELVVPAYVVDVRRRAANADTFELTVSDHLPVVGHFLRVRADDD
ncbi:endonuclease/exonuclease/phosphatase family protein [Arhodomonas aquaeolei]|uniref:endonuclease/exonuclease/phosphatase family protein n=1 Tax=Arhodomonas aquaeolei TaxID=2369 RepID=UPI0021695D1F|nr:endonuclease/exonuclease/phosphatase family protein [Arhodomonas aquaeolei]MCS4504291.1 endonuclease/exonuclease/phosphatase family protein [Arhodomonas aquaeolei]